MTTSRSQDSTSQVSANIYPSLEEALSSVQPEIDASAPDADSDEDNESIALPSYDDVMSGKF